MKEKVQPEIIPANAREIHSVEFLAGLDAQLIEGQETLRERLQKIPGGWRRFRLAVTTVEKLLDDICATLPTKTLLHMQRICQYGQIIIRPKPMVKLGDEVQIIGETELRMLINTCIKNECAICVKNRAEQKGCKLRKALHDIAPVEVLNKDGSCNYIDVAAGNEYGKYI